MTVRAISKREAKVLKPDKRTLLISIQDGPTSVLPMRERTNHITRRRYVEVLFLYFDDINPDEIDGSPKFPFAFSDFDARSIINFVKRHMDNGDFDEIVVHCEAGISRSQAVALFIAKHMLHDDDLYEQLYNDPTKLRGGNKYVYSKLVDNISKAEI